MTKYADLVRAEADEAESDSPDEPDADTATEQESPTEPEPDTAAPVAFGPDQQRKVENAIEAQRRKLAGILGDEGVQAECVLCGGLGFAPEAPPDGLRFEVSHEGGAAHVVFVPPDVPPELLPAPDREQCPECAGYGLVLSGSRNPNHVAEQCNKCNGNGWIVKARQEQQYPQPLLPPIMTHPATEPALANGAPDQWGRPVGHAHYGIAPALIAS